MDGIESTRLVDLAVQRGMLPAARAAEARALSPDQIVERGLIDRREMDLLLNLAGEPRLLFDRYEVLAEIGRGGFGVVYKCRDRRLDRIVALKGVGGGIGGDVDRFEREARTAAQLRHPHIVPVHDFGRRGNDLYLTMDFIDGAVFGPPVEPRRAAELVAQVARALDYAHRAGVVHRDVKPENILVDAAGAHLADFGLARRVEGDVTITVSGMIMGTPPYMSPEQAVGGKLDARTDIYNLGATLYHALAGHAPHRGQNAMEIVVQIVGADPPPPPGPTDLVTICVKAMEREPARRYASAGEMAEDLERWLRGEAIRARPPSLGYRLRRRLVRHRGVATAIAVAVAALAIAAIATAWSWVADVNARAEARVHLDAGRGVMARLDRRLGTDTWTADEIAHLAGEARAEFENALNAYPNHPEALLEIARSYEMQQQRDRAVEFATRAIDAEPGFATARLKRALLRLEAYEEMRHLTSGEAAPQTPEGLALLASIRDDIEAVRRWSSEQHELLFAEGAVAFAEGRFEEAAEKLQRYAEAAVSDPVGWYLAGHAWLHVPGREAEALRPMEEMLRYRPRDAGGFMYRGMARRAAGDPSGAIADYTRAMEIAPPYTSALFNRGRVYLELQKLDAALADFRRCVELRPDWTMAYFELGNALTRKRALPGARAAFDRAIQLDPRDHRSFVNRANLHRLMNDFDAAEADLDRAEALAPDVPHVHATRAQVRADRGDVDGALALLNKALALDPNYPGALMNRGVLYAERFNRPRDAVADFTKALEADPALWDAYKNRAISLIRLNRPAEAVADYDRALDLNPDDPELHNNRGIARRMAGDPQGAIDDATRAIELRPAWGTAY